MMWWKRIATVSLVAGMFVSVGASGVGATEDDPIFEDGRYILVIIGVGDFVFDVDYVEPAGEETVIAYMAPGGYSVDDDDPAKAAWKEWKDAASLEVEMKLDKIESNVTWGTNGEATLTLRDGSIITVFAPDADGDFKVEMLVSDGPWTVFGWGDDWIVANNIDIAVATRFFKVEATPDGIEIKAVSRPLPGDGFLKDLKEEYEEEEEEEAEEAESEDVESEDDDSEGAGHGKEKNQGKGKNN